MRSPFKSGFISVAAVMMIAVSCAAQENRQIQTALAFEEQGRIADAEAVWHDYVKSHPNDAEAFAHLGMLAARQEQYSKAVAYDRKALALKPSVGVRLNLGLALFKSEDMDGAIQIFKQLIRDGGLPREETTRVTTLLGAAQYGKGDYTGAIPNLRKAVESDPQNLPFRLLLAHSCLWSKQYQCVLDVYREILSLNPESAEAYLLAGEAYDGMKNDAGAMEQFRAAVNADPHMPNVHFALGYALWRVMRFEEAAKEFNAEIDINPEHAQALTFLADIDIRNNQAEAAMPLLLRAVKADPNIALAHLNLGILYSGSGKDQDALRELQIAAKLNPGDQNVHWRLGQFYKAAGKTAEAKAEFEKTRTLQRAADQSVFEQLHRAQSRGNTNQLLSEPPPAR